MIALARMCGFGDSTRGALTAISLPLLMSACPTQSVIITPGLSVLDTLIVTDTTLAGSPGSLTLRVGESTRLVAQAVDALGLSVPIAVTWTSDQPAVASVDATGRVAGQSPGQANILAIAGSVSATVPTTVVEGPVPPPPPPPPPPTLATPNEAAGNVPLTSQPYDDALSNPDRYGWGHTLTGLGTFTQISDASAPASPTSVARQTYSGPIGGSQPAYSRFEFVTPRPRSLYVSAWLRFDPNWEYPASLESRILLLEDGSGTPRVQVFVLNDPGTGDTRLRTRIIGGGPPPPPAPGAGNFSNGVWHQLEAVFEGNSDPASADGRIRIWLDGVLQLDASGLQVFSSLPLEFGAFRWQPAWGATSGSPSAPIFHDMDHIYLSEGS